MRAKCRVSSDAEGFKEMGLSCCFLENPGPSLSRLRKAGKSINTQVLLPEPGQTMQTGTVTSVRGIHSPRGAAHEFRAMLWFALFLFLGFFTLKIWQLCMLLSPGELTAWYFTGMVCVCVSANVWWWGCLIASSQSQNIYLSRIFQSSALMLQE